MSMKERLQTLLETSRYFNLEIDKEQNAIIIEDDEGYFHSYPYIRSLRNVIDEYYEKMQSYNILE